MNKNFFNKLVMLSLISLLGLFIFYNPRTSTKAAAKVSVIVPVYKVEKWINECIDSLINQTLKEIEIICIDDGSPDNCGKILDDYKKKDDRIIVIHQKNQGVAAARNAGLNVASGEYISFVDSDDYLEKETYEIAYKWAKKDDIDILQFCSRQFDDGCTPEKLDNSCSDSEVLNLEQFLHKSYASYIVWNNLFKNDLIKQDKIRFLNYSVGEDTCFAYSSYARAKKFKILNDVFYNYRQHPNSTMKTSDFSDAFYKINYPVSLDIYNSWKSRNLIDGNEMSLLTILADRLMRFDERLDEADEILKISEDIYNKVSDRAPEWMKNEMSVLRNASKYNKVSPIEDGIYKIQSALDQNLVLGVNDTSNGSKLRILTSNDSDSQKFEVKLIKNYYSISPLSSKKLLDVQDGLKLPGTPVQQWGEETKYAHRQWYIVPCGDGNFKIISKLNFLALDSNDSKKGTKILCQNDNNSIYQKFKFMKIA